MTPSATLRAAKETELPTIKPELLPLHEQRGEISTADPTKIILSHHAIANFKHL
jgi:hypothetical protein